MSTTTTHLMTAEDLLNMPDHGFRHELIRSLWLVTPAKRTVEEIHSDGNCGLFHEDDELVDDTVPGFRVAVSKIFE